MKKVRYYKTYNDDFEHTANQDFKLPQNYKWVKRDFLSIILSHLIYGIAVIFGGLYCRLFLHLKIKGKKSIKGLKGNCFIYCNHTQPVGDVFIPAICVLPKRIYTVVSSANYGIPVIGKILPYLGALPIADSISGIKQLNNAIDYRLNEGHPIVIFPEAHVWEYYNDIRPFANTSFKYPVKYNVATVVMTVTYRKSKFFKRPITEVYLDGPYYPEGDTLKEKINYLHDKVYVTMKKRAENSDFEYIKYINEYDNG